MNTIIEELNTGDFTPQQVLQILRNNYANGTPCFLLESGEPNGGTGKYSFLGIDPFEIYRSSGEDPLPVLKEKMNHYWPETEEKYSLPFTSGIVGFFSYEMLHHFEKVPHAKKDDLKIPDAIFMFFDTILCFDHEQKKCFICLTRANDVAKANQRIDKIKLQLSLSPQVLGNNSPPCIQRELNANPPCIQRELNATPHCIQKEFYANPPCIPPFSGGKNANKKHNSPLRRGDARRAEGFSISLDARRAEGFSISLDARRAEGFLNEDKEEGLGIRGEKFEANMTPSDFLSIVQRAKDYIKAGDTYQVNLSQRFTTPFTGDPFQLYETLTEINPSPFGGFLDFGDLQIVSCSPERLLELRGREVQTRPIAGTGTVEQGHSLHLSEKDRAEHIMLVDLERNDLGRICEYGSVQVNELMTVEPYSHVSHIVSNVRGLLKKGLSWSDVLKACFPGGTITGTPKVRTMEIISELEPTARGPYTGSMGYINSNGDMDLNIIIRSFVIKDNIAYLQVGAGIVADSDPQKEYEETMHKAEALRLAIANYL